MRRAYVILAHEQIGHLERLCSALRSDDARCFVHFDAANGPCPSLPSNAEPVPDPLRVNHGGYSLTAAMITSLRHAMTYEFDRVFFLSGRDYPIKPDYELVAFLEDHPTTNFINFYPLLPGADFHHHVSQRFFVDERRRLPRVMQRGAMNVERATRLVLPSRRFPLGHTPFRGSAFFSLDRRAAEHVISFLGSPAGTTYERFFRRSWGSDEMLFQSILLNSSLAPTCRFYERDIDRPMTNENQASLHYIDWDPARERPAVLDERDLDRLLASDLYFARKFDEHRSATLLDELDRVRSTTPKEPS